MVDNELLLLLTLLSKDLELCGYKSACGHLRSENEALLASLYILPQLFTHMLT